MYIKPSDSQPPSEPNKPAQSEITYTRIIGGEAKPVDLSTLSSIDQKTLSLVKDSLQMLKAPTGTYALSSEGKITNVKTGDTYYLSHKEEAEKAIEILRGSERTVVIGIELKSAPDLKAAGGLRHIITEHFETEKSFYNSFAQVAHALNSDRAAFVETLKKNGVTEEEIKLIFEPLTEAAQRVGAFRDELGEIKEQLALATTSNAYHVVMERYTNLIKTQYEAYTESLHKLMLAQKYFTEFGKLNVQGSEKNRISEAVDAYFNQNNIKNPFGRAGLHMSDTMIGFVQRLPRHELLFKDANDKSKTLGADHTDTLTFIKNQNALIGNDMPPPIALGIREDQFSPELKKDLIAKGWKERDFKNFVEIYNNYNKESKSLEILYFLKQKFPSNYRLSSELLSLAQSKQKNIDRFNQQLEKWGGTPKLRQLNESQEKLNDTLYFGKKLEAKQATIKNIYTQESHLSKNLVHQYLDLTSLQQIGWTMKDVDRFNTIYTKHAQAYDELKLAFLKSGENIDDTDFQKVAQKIIPRMQAAQKEFLSFGGFEKIENLYKVSSEIDFHAQMHKQVDFANAVEHVLKLKEGR